MSIEIRTVFGKFSALSSKAGLVCRPSLRLMDMKTNQGNAYYKLNFRYKLVRLVARRKEEIITDSVKNASAALYNNSYLSAEIDVDALIRTIVQLFLYENFNKVMAKSQGWI